MSKSTPNLLPPSPDELTQLVVDLERELVKKLKRDLEIALKRDIDLKEVVCPGYSKSEIFILFENFTNK
jgi:hypothetical protein